MKRFASSPVNAIDRLGRHAQLLHRVPNAIQFVFGDSVNSSGSEALQTDKTLPGASNLDSYVQSVRQGTGLARLLSRLGHRRLRQPHLLRGTPSGMFVFAAKK